MFNNIAIIFPEMPSGPTKLHDQMINGTKKSIFLLSNESPNINM